jgi:hypothetical protein
MSTKHYQYEIYLDGKNPILLTKYFPAPDGFVPHKGDFISIYNKTYLITRTEPADLTPTQAGKIYVLIPDPLQPNTNHNTLNPIEYQAIFRVF